MSSSNHAATKRPRDTSDSDLQQQPHCSKSVPEHEHNAPSTSKHIKLSLEVLEDADEDTTTPHLTYTPLLGHIHSISDKELLKIFSYLSLSQQIEVERVCPRWQAFSITINADQTVLRLVQKSQLPAALTDLSRYLFFTEHRSWLPLEERAVHVNQKITEAEIGWISVRFPRIKHLALYCVDHLSISMFVKLVERYPDLETLELFCTDTQKEEYYCDQFWEALDRLRKLKYIHLPFDYGQQTAENKILDKLYMRVTMIFHRSGNSRPERFEPTEPEYQHPVTKLAPLKRCCLMDEDGRLGQFLLRFDHCPLPSDPINAVITGLGLYSGHIQIRELSQRLNLVKFGTLVMNNEANLTHIDLDVPCNVQFTPFLGHLSTLRALSDLRLTARRDPQTRQREHLFNNLTLENYQTTAQPVISRLKNLTLARFEFNRDDPVLVHFLPWIFPNLTSIHFEDCRLQRYCDFWYSLFTRIFSKLTEVRHNNSVLLEVERDRDEDPPEVREDRKRRLLKKIPLLYRKRAPFGRLHEIAKRLNGNFRINGAEFMEEFNRRRVLDVNNHELHRRILVHVHGIDIDGEEEDEDEEDEEAEAAEVVPEAGDDPGLAEPEPDEAR